MCEKMSDILKTVFEKQMYTDIVLISKDNDHRINVHSSVLIAGTEFYSNYFNEKGPMPGATTFVIPDMNANILSTMVHYLYSGEVDIFDTKTAFQIWKGAVRWGIPELKLYALDFLCKTFTPDDYHRYKNISKYEVKVTSTLTDYVMKTLRDSKGNDFWDENLEGFKDFLKLSQLSIDQNILAATIVAHNVKNPSATLDFCELLDFSKLTDREIILRVQRNCDSSRTMSNLFKKLDCKVLSAPILIMPNSKMLVAVTEDGSDRKCFLYYNTKNGLCFSRIIDFSGTVIGFWKNQTVLLIPKQSVVFNFDIVLFSNCSNDSKVLGNYSNCGIDSFKVIDDNLYYFGKGRCGVIDLNTGLRRRFCTTSGMLLALTSFGSQLLFVLRDSQQNIRVREYHKSQDNDNCKTCTSLKFWPYFDIESKSAGSAVIVKDILYFFGDVIILYNLRQLTWKNVPQFKEKVTSAEVFNDKLFCISGDMVSEMNSTRKPLNKLFYLPKGKSQLFIAS